MEATGRRRLSFFSCIVAGIDQDESALLAKGSSIETNPLHVNFFRVIYYPFFSFKKESKNPISTH